MWRREQGTAKQRKILTQWPITMSKHYLHLLNKPMTTSEEEALTRSEEKSIPFGRDTWVHRVTKRYGIEQVLRGVGRPKNDG